MEFRTVALIGAGAVGCFFIRGLSDVLGSNFCLVADGERADRLRNQGLVINGEQVFPNIRTDQRGTGLSQYPHSRRSCRGGPDPDRHKI